MSHPRRNDGKRLGNNRIWSMEATRSGGGASKMEETRKVSSNPYPSRAIRYRDGSFDLPYQFLLPSVDERKRITFWMVGCGFKLFKMRWAKGGPVERVWAKELEEVITFNSVVSCVEIQPELMERNDIVLIKR